MTRLRYDDQVVVVTGAGNGLGKSYAKFFAARGAKVVVNDLGGSINGSGKGSAAHADVVVAEIKKSGGIAVPNYNAVQDGDRIIETAIQNFGRVDILINNAGILRDTTLKNMKDADWDIIMDVHVNGAIKTTKAAWPYFQKQGYGKIIHTTSASGLFGNFGQSNYAAAKVALVGLTKSLAQEGAAHNITSNVIAPAAGSRLTETVWTPEMMNAFSTDFVVPLVGALVHKSCKENGSIFEAGSGHFSKIRIERAQGFLAKPDENLTAQLILDNHGKIFDFQNGVHPDNAADCKRVLSKTVSCATNPSSDDSMPGFKDKIVLVVGDDGTGIQRSYSIALAKLGAKVAICGWDSTQKLVDEIKASGGQAIGLKMTPRGGEKIVRDLIQTHGRIDIVLNCGIPSRSNAFENITDDVWASTIDQQLRTVWQISRAAWPFMIRNRFGRFVNIISSSGFYGAPGDANHSVASCGLIGLTKTIAREGAKYDIRVNAVAPLSGAGPESVTPLLIALCSDKPPASGQLYEAGNGWFAGTRWQRARGADFEHSKGPPEVEVVAKGLDQICKFDSHADNPEAPGDGSKLMMENVMKNPALKMQQEDTANRRNIGKVYKAMQMKGEVFTYNYTERDVMLYNLGVGAKRTDLDLVFEKSPNFQVLPTFGIVPNYHVKAPYKLAEVIPNFDMRKLLHGEQFLEIKQFPIPTSGTLKSSTQMIEAIDKGNATLVRTATTTTDEAGKPVFYTESVSFIREAGGWGGPRSAPDRGAATAANNPPSRLADKVIEEKTSEESAALFRLMGDWNPLHISPEFAAVGGFKVPILHGLATFGVSGKHVYQSYGPFKNIKVRFSGTVLPGQTIVTEMWKVNNKIVYRAKVKETGKSCISNAAVELIGGQSTL